MVFATCHCHSTFSDDDFTPETLVDIAKKNNYGAIVLTDHDTVKGSFFLQKAARKAGLLSMVGCEFSVKGLGTSFHLVGIDFNTENTRLRDIIRRGASHHTVRAKMLFEYGIKEGLLRGGLTWQDILDDHPDHDFFCTTQVFESYLKRGIYTRDEHSIFKPVFSFKSEKSKEIEPELAIYDVDIEEAVSAIKNAGGIPIVAHPYNRMEMADDLLAIGVMGFETSHPGLSPEEREFFDAFCREKGLYVSGGTDHSSIFGGAHLQYPKHDKPKECGYVTEEDFMNMYYRKLG